jgi:hypothetical protein
MKAPEIGFNFTARAGATLPSATPKTMATKT